jgi:TPP-dependent pyruvate/acetoin dehydrogenase alpha subunit
MSQTTALESTLNERLGYPSEQLKDMLLKMHLTRFFEDAAFQQYSLGNVHGTMHLCAGQEAVAIGATAALRPDDAITSTHRGHGHAIAKGQDINTMMAELLAKETGVCRGRGGSMHMADVNLGSLGANGVVSGGIPLSVGAGLSIRLHEIADRGALRRAARRGRAAALAA